MRADMKKVLTERPRVGGRYSYHDIRSRDKRLDPDDLPSHEGMRYPYGYDNKEFSDLLGPLRRYMHGCIGRRWDDVWSELCANVRADSTSGDHLRQHALRECERHTYVVDDKVLVKGYSFYRGWGEADGLYVDPRDGLIHYKEPRHHYHHYEKPIVVDGLAYSRRDDGVLLPHANWRRHGKYAIKVIGDRRAVWIAGIWYWAVMADVPPPVSVPYLVDGVTKYRTVEFPRYDFVLGDNVKSGRYHVSKRQMSSHDLRRHGLVNG